MKIISRSQTVAHDVTYSVLMKLVGEGIWQWTCLGELCCQKENRKM